MYTSKTSGWGAITEQVEGRAWGHTYLEGVVEGGFGFAAEVRGGGRKSPLRRSYSLSDGRRQRTQGTRESGFHGFWVGGLEHGGGVKECLQGV